VSSDYKAPVVDLAHDSKFSRRSSVFIVLQVPEI
jgi:hypothetical protein